LRGSIELIPSFGSRGLEKERVIPWFGGVTAALEWAIPWFDLVTAAIEVGGPVVWPPLLG